MPCHPAPRHLDPSDVYLDPWLDTVPQEMSDRDRRGLGRLLVAHRCSDFGAPPMMASPSSRADLRLDLGDAYPDLVVQTVAGPSQPDIHVFDRRGADGEENGRTSRVRLIGGSLRALVLLDRGIVVFTTSAERIEIPSSAVPALAAAERESFFAALYERDLVSEAEYEDATLDPGRAAISMIA